jgi:hypothetical protein
MKFEAFNVAFDNCKNPSAASDAAVAAKASQLQLTDPEYQSFKGFADGYRRDLAQANVADVNDANRAKPAPAVKPQPAAPPKPTS